MRATLLILLLAFPAAIWADGPTAMGAEWFAKLRNPKMRVKALYERYKRDHGNDQDPDSREKFIADHSKTWVFPAPQQGAPDAWAVVTLLDWGSSRPRHMGGSGKFPRSPRDEIDWHRQRFCQRHRIRPPIAIGMQQIRRTRMEVFRYNRPDTPRSSAGDRAISI